MRFVLIFEKKGQVFRRKNEIGLAANSVLGVVGYDQWQVTADSGTLASGLPARLRFSAGRGRFGSLNQLLLRLIDVTGIVLRRSFGSRHRRCKYEIF
jgi:hypothetical protein